MSLLDYFLRRRKSFSERHDPTSPIATAVALTTAPAPTTAPRPKRSPVQDLIAGSKAMGNVALMFQKDSYAWSATARHLARIVADVIMPDASDDEHDEYARELAYEIMKAEAEHYESVIS